MILGSNQSPSDIDTMIMVLNGAKDRFVEQYKPIDEVRRVALERLNKMCNATKNWHYPVEKINETECKEFLRGSRLLADASMIDGDTIEEKVIAAFKSLRTPEIRAALDDKLQTMINAINNETDPQRVLEISRDEVFYLKAIDDYANECPEYGAFAVQLPSSSTVRLVFCESANYGANALRRLVNLLGQEKATSETVFDGTLSDTLCLARPDMIDVVGITDHKPTAIEKLAHVIHGLWVPVDRSETLPSPLKLTAPKIPNVGSFNETFENVADARAAALWDENKKISVFWSGGIDSTVALVALLKTVPTNRLSDLTVHYSDASIDEYPQFYADHIDGKLTVAKTPRTNTPADRYLAEDIFLSNTTKEIAKSLKTNLVVTGELGDQCFGSASFATNQDRISSTVDDFLAQEDFLDIRDEIDALSDACPIEIKTVPTLMWWWNFTLKWSEVRYRSLTAVNDPESFANVRHFFDTDDFQRWSIANDNLKIKSTPETYKFTAKDYIHAFAKHDVYRDKKLKVGSLGVRWGKPLAIDSNHTIISAGDTSTNLDLIKTRYGDRLERYATCP
tara:strand:+ start:2165 stop:3859 length:1695 start_codon:yes stop_codon:yes gene_type:complete